MKLIKSSFLSLLLVGLMITSCNNDDESVDPGVAPELPPAQSMSMDFSNFQDENGGGRLMESNNWGRAATVVAFWNTVLTVNLAVPVASFKAAVNHSASFNNDEGLWVWSYDYDFVGKTYSAELTAELNDAEVEWKMYISKEGGFQDVLWFSGVMKADGSSGYWLLNKNANNPTEYLRIDWTKTNEDIGSIKYTYTLESADEFGSSIEYAKTDDADFNRAYTIFLSKTDNTVNIEWNAEGSNGKIKDSNHFQDEEFHCWDSDFMDTDC